MNSRSTRFDWHGSTLAVVGLVALTSGCASHAVAPPAASAETPVAIPAAPAPASAPAAIAAAAAPAASASDGVAPFDLADAARIAAGKKRFGSNCAAYCHGSEGDGGKTPPFKGRSEFSPAGTYKTISEGRRGVDIMPPWGKAFQPEQIWELVAYLQYLSTQPPTAR